MAKYHVGKDGQARPCKAASPDSCPLAKADDSGVVKHFDSLDAAQSYGERVAMGLVGEGSSHAAPVPGMHDGHYVDDTGYVYPKVGQKWSDKDRAAFVQQAAYGLFVSGAYDPDDPSADESEDVHDELEDVVRGYLDWSEMQWRHDCARDSMLSDPGFMSDEEWDALGSEYPVITDDGGIREAKDSERPATEDEISEYVSSENADALQNDVSMVPSSDGLGDSPRFDAATAEEKFLIWASLDRGDAAVASGDFDAAEYEYEIAAKPLGYDFRTNSFHSSEPVIKRLDDRLDMARAASDAYVLSMSDLPNDPYYDEERQLKSGTFALDGISVIPFDLDDDGDDDEDGISR